MNVKEIEREWKKLISIAKDLGEKKKYCSAFRFYQKALLEAELLFENSYHFNAHYKVIEMFLKTNYNLIHLFEDIGDNRVEEYHKNLVGRLILIIQSREYPINLRTACHNEINRVMVTMYNSVNKDILAKIHNEITKARLIFQEDLSKFDA